ncbi:DUF7344 domain-containing protein [Haladaptatus halobius]|uniref:DUF7344 domain-containing protein n=1 Tax=Haladaptatus halobius TaxID=2884875 RepID=UPI001D0AE3D7|nr:HalOD1 output domain-containing protein [Haladaptatus halobius]
MEDVHLNPERVVRHVLPDQIRHPVIALFDTVVGGLTLDGSSVSPNVLSTLVGSRRRRSVCRYLAEVGDPADVSSTADRIAEWESTGVPSEDARERVHITLHHVHLPKLVEARVVERDGDDVSATVSASELERYVRLAGAGDAPPEAEPLVRDGRNSTTSTSVDGSNEAYWTVYGTARDSVAVSLARALGAVSNVHPTELRPALAEVIDVDALQRLAEREEVSVYVQFWYEEYEVVVDSGEIRLYVSE